MINVLINGCNGKMGQEVAKAISDNNQFNVISGVDRIDSKTNIFPVYSNTDGIVEKPDVIIDFSSPSYTLNILEYAKNNKTPIVIATTGFNDNELNKIISYSQYIPIFKSANLSISINLMLNIVSKISKVLSDADIEIVEKHHNKKVDSPSGTALLIADTINETLNNELYYEYSRHSKKESRNKKELGIHSIRGGNIVGEHSVFFINDDESLELTHNITSRTVFAKGALNAAKFIIDKSNGMYDMKDLIK